MKSDQEIKEEIECILVDNAVSEKKFVELSETIQQDYGEGLLDENYSDK